MKLENLCNVPESKEAFPKQSIRVYQMVKGRIIEAKKRKHWIYNPKY